jgi:predicted transport protein
MEGGFRFSPLKLNLGLSGCGDWNEATIQERATKLADKAVDIWAAPVLAGDILEVYRTKGKENGTGYSIDDHPHLSGGPTLELYKAFRQAVLALDECVREDFLKLYVAYKAETNFVDIVPQAKRLRLSLNMNFHEIDDPLGVCKDVTGVGRWGNGNVEIGLDKVEDIPYVIGLVRQSLERQLGGEAAEE